MEVKEIDTSSNRSENLKEVRKESLWKNDHCASIKDNSDFTLNRLNDVDIASKNGMKIKSFSDTSEILNITGN